MIDAIRASRSACAYLWAKEFVVQNGFGDEITWQRSVQSKAFDEVDFLRESAWVVLSAGMRETVVRKSFPRISKAFLDWSDSRSIVESRDECVESALQVFNHRKKIQAIADIAGICQTLGFEKLQSRIAELGITFLQQLPYIGPITCCHLAKNLGIDTAKADRHLLRIAHVTGYDCPHLLCSELSSVVGDEIAVIDVVIWRFATLRKDYLNVFQDPGAVINSHPKISGSRAS